MSDNAVAFYIGLFGSIHCIGMCGPLAFALPAGHGNRLWLIWDKLVYQFGRIVSYSALGLVIGLIGKQLWLLGLQQGISLLSGALIILAATARLLKWSLFNSRSSGGIIKLINRSISYALQNRWGHLWIGMLNGLLPCGFVYLALLGAVNTHTVPSAITYMFFFGAGTLPLMLLATIGSGFISIPVRRKLNYVVPYFMLLLGVWFIFRGLNLDIPYLSPGINAAPSSCR